MADVSRRALNEAIVVEPVEQSPGTLRATINGVEIGTTPASAITQIRIDAGRGNDRVTVQLGDAAKGISVIVFGGAGHDRIGGAGEVDEFHGGSGNDRLDSGGGNDTLIGDAGSDQLLAGDGDDTLIGGGGNDVLAGGWGRDSLAGEKGLDKLRGGADDDQLDGGPGNDRLEGGNGADYLFGGKGADRMLRQEGVDIIGLPSGSASNQPDKRDDVADDNTTDPAVRQQSDDELKQWLIEAAVKQWKWAFGQPAYPWGYFFGIDGEVHIGRGGDAVTSPPAPDPQPVPGGDLSGVPRVDSDPGAGAGAEGQPPSTSNPDHSDTNTQEAGVDEADLAETDGNLIYTLHEHDLVVVDATPADQMSVISRTAFEGDAVGIYLHGSRLTVVSATYSWRMIDPIPLAEADPVAGAPRIIAPPSEPPKASVFVTVFDVSNAAAPTQIEKTTLDGTYADSRLIENRLYLVVQNDTWVPPPLIIPNSEDPQPDPPSTDSLSIWRPGGLPGGTYESEESYRARLQAMTLEDLLPSYHATARDGDTHGLLVKSTDAYVRDLASSELGQNLTTVALLDVGDTAGGPDATTTVAGFGGTVYASPDALYLAGAQYSADGSESRVMKFELGVDSVPLVATGNVDGYVLDQFSMSESGDFFRVATSGWSSETGDVANNLFVLEQVGDELQTAGSITDIKEGEQLRSTRFVGDHAYLVTFRQVDPLITVNLSSPTKPRITGELTIPGFSSYLQSIGDGLLLGLGRDIDPDTNRDRGLQLSLFDVSDDAHPVRLDAIRLSENWASSEAEFEHHAFAYFSDQRILALPVNHFDDVDGSVSSLVVVHIDPTKGADALQTLGEPSSEDEVRRSLRIGDVLYAVGADQVHAMKLAAPTEILGTVNL
jgi:uncharacterized secreted protein with C-terminal beta-propeller domain